MMTMNCDPILEKKLLDLKELLTKYAPLAIAFSGGVDSAFLLGYALAALPQPCGQLQPVTAITAAAPNFAPDEIEYARQFCRQNKIPHLLAEMGADILHSFSHNPPDRCYICKKAIFSRVLSELCTAFGAGNITLADGTNADDALDYRPGAKALAELSVVSPLKEAGLTKAEIRQGLRMLYESGALTKAVCTLPGGSKIWDKPAFACLASRIPYGEPITTEKLSAVYAMEKALHDHGFLQVRVRCHGEITPNGGGAAVARIEVLPQDREQFFDTGLMDQIDRIAKESGFAYAALDLCGYKMGNMNINL